MLPGPLKVSGFIRVPLMSETMSVISGVVPDDCSPVPGSFTSASASGWQPIIFSQPVSIEANTVYVASYNTGSGHYYAVDQNYFVTQVDNGPLHALSSSESGGNGVYTYGAASISSSSYLASNYWVDVLFKPTGSTGLTPTAPPFEDPTPTASAGAAGTCTSVSQYGITFSFTKAYPCGTFANGDHWVAPNAGETTVTITSMSPAAASGRNGWLVNPTSTQESYDNRLDDYNAALMPALPYSATANKSIVKTISYSGTCGNDGSLHNPCLLTASVLTVLGNVPAGNGAGLFRPPYFGTAKPLYSTSQLQTQLLPTLAPVGAPTLDSVKNRYQRVQLDHTDNWYGRYMHPRENFMTTTDGVHNYGSDIASDNNDTALRLMLE